MLPSGLTETDDGPRMARPSAQAPPLPESLMQPSGPASWVSAPVVESRAKTSTLFDPADAT